MTTFQIECPEELVGAGGREKADLQRIAQEAFLVRLYGLGDISSGRAAALLGMSRRDFLDVLNGYGLSPFDEDIDLQAEARRGR